MSTLKCKCGLNFTFSRKDKKFYNNSGFPDPKRCPLCRSVKKHNEFNSLSYYEEQLADDDYEGEYSNIISANFTNNIIENSLFKGALLINYLNEKQISFNGFKLWYNNYIEDINNNNYEINNIGFKSINGVYLYAIFPAGHFYKAKELAATMIKYPERNKYIDIHSHLYINKSHNTHINEDVWIDPNTNIIFGFGEDNIRNLYAVMTEEILDSLSFRLKAVETSTLISIIQRFNDKNIIDIFDKKYPEQSKSLIEDIIEREKSFRGIQ